MSDVHQETNQSEPPHQKLIKHYITLKQFLEPVEDLDEHYKRRKEPRCFLCNIYFHPDLKTGENKATAVELDFYTSKEGLVQNYALLCDRCCDKLMQLFSAFFEDFMYASLFEGGLKPFVEEGYKSPFKRIEL